MSMYRDPSIIADYGIDPTGFVLYGKSGGREEFHGPCWSASCRTDGGNTDRMTVTVGKFRKTEHGLFVCRVCGLKGRLDQFVSEDTDWEDVKRERAEARELALREAAEKRENVLKWLNEWDVANKLHEKIWHFPAVLTDLGKDGIYQEQVIKWKIGYNPNFVYYVDKERKKGGAISFPIIRDGRTIHIRMRLVDQVNGNKYRPIRAGLAPTFMYCGYPDDTRIFILEGEKKAIVLNGYGIPTIGLFGVNVWRDEWGQWIKDRFEHRFVLFDNEPNNEGVLRAAKRVMYSADAVPVVVPGKPDDFMNEVRNVNIFFENMRRLKI